MDAKLIDILSFPLTRPLWLRVRSTTVWPMQDRWGTVPMSTVIAAGQRVRVDGAWRGMAFVTTDPEAGTGGWVPASMLAAEASGL